MTPQQKKGAELKKSNSTIKMQGEAEVAQLVEQTIRNRQVAGSIPALGSKLLVCLSESIS
jgi:hypothetical protein